jgi:hypothetical protein
MMFNARLSLPSSRDVNTTVTLITLSSLGLPSLAALISVISGYNKAFFKSLVSSHIGATFISSWFQAVLGMSISFLVDTDTPLPHFESKWLQSLRAFLSHCSGSFLLDNYHIPPLQRNGDSYIMDTVLASELFNSTKIRRINYCQLYLQVVTLSNLCDALGEYLDTELYYGRITAGHSYTTWHSFNQDRPSSLSWQQWR